MNKKNNYFLSFTKGKWKDLKETRDSYRLSQSKEKFLNPLILSI